jgi:hypothetical protein
VCMHELDVSRCAVWTCVVLSDKDYYLSRGLRLGCITQNMIQHPCTRVAVLVIAAK